MKTGFTGSPIDRADNIRLDEARVAELRRSPEARLLRLAALEPELDANDRLIWDPVDGAADTIFLGMQGGAPRFAPLTRIEPGQNVWSVFRLLALMPPGDAAIWGAAYSLIAWHSRHGFCANCGSPTKLFRAGWGRQCPNCHADHFPRVDPVVIMLAEYQGRVLIGREGRYPPGRYSALAGYVEPGESFEEAVAREIEEEAGIKVRNVRYLASQPWPLSGALMIACLVEAESDRIVLDRHELKDAIWVDRADVRAAFDEAPGAKFLAPTPIAIASTLLRHWLETEPLATPVPAA